MGVVRMSDIQPVEHWDTDFDVLDDRYVRDPFPIWDELREEMIFG